jgi:hypothetical protein
MQIHKIKQAVGIACGFPPKEATLPYETLDLHISFFLPLCFLER